MQAVVRAADVQDRDGGVLLMAALFGLYPFLLKLYADSGYLGAKFRDGLGAACAHVNDEIVKRSDLPKFVVLPRRMDRRTNHRLAKPLPPTGQRLGLPQSLRASVPTLGIHTPHAPKPLPNHKMIPDGL